MTHEHRAIERYIMSLMPQASQGEVTQRNLSEDLSVLKDKACEVQLCPRWVPELQRYSRTLHCQGAISVFMEPVSGQEKSSMLMDMEGDGGTAGAVKKQEVERGCAGLCVH